MSKTRFEMYNEIFEDNEKVLKKEVADLMGISQSYISRIEKKILDRLKKDLLKSS